VHRNERATGVSIIPWPHAWQGIAEGDSIPFTMKLQSQEIAASDEVEPTN